MPTANISPPTSNCIATRPKDPGELNNIAEQHPDMVRSLLKAMTDWHTGAAGVPKPGEEVNLDALDENTLELLRSLGYVDSP